MKWKSLHCNLSLCSEITVSALHVLIHSVWAEMEMEHVQLFLSLLGRSRFSKASVRHWFISPKISVPFKQFFKFLSSFWHWSGTFQFKFNSISLWFQFLINPVRKISPEFLFYYSQALQHFYCATSGNVFFARCNKNCWQFVNQRNIFVLNFHFQFTNLLMNAFKKSMNFIMFARLSCRWSFRLLEQSLIIRLGRWFHFPLWTNLSSPLSIKFLFHSVTFISKRNQSLV